VTDHALAVDLVLARAPGASGLDLPDGGLTVFVAGTATAYVLNGSAASVWRLVDGVAPVAGILALLREQHPTAVLDQDVTSILSDLLASGLLEPAGRLDP
jgi:hypothetical protein